MNDDNIVFNGLNIGFIGFAECSEGALKEPIEMGYVSEGHTKQPTEAYTSHSNRLTRG